MSAAFPQAISAGVVIAMCGGLTDADDARLTTGARIRLNGRVTLIGGRERTFWASERWHSSSTGNGVYEQDISASPLMGAARKNVVAARVQPIPGAHCGHRNAGLGRAGPVRDHALAVPGPAGPSASIAFADRECCDEGPAQCCFEGVAESAGSVSALRAAFPARLEVCAWRSGPCELADAVSSGGASTDSILRVRVG